MRTALACRRLTALLLVGFAHVAAAQVSVLTYHYDDARTGQNTQETTLSPANVASSTFGLKFTQRVDGYVYAQPLYVPGVNIPGQGTHNVVYVATENDSVYAFDADTGRPTNPRPLWRAKLLDRTLGERAVPSRDTNCADLIPKVGITSTPVIDPGTSTLYVLAKVKQRGSQYAQKLHALDLATGVEKLGGPVVIQATVSGTGDGSNGGTIAFDPLREHQRAALTLANGNVYIAWASHCDNGPYHGWVMAYDQTSLAQVAVYNTTPDGGLGGVWQSGGGPALDAGGNLFLATGNGTFDAQQPTPPNDDYGDTLLQLTPALSFVDYFTPFNEDALNQADNDLGSGAPLVLPDQSGPNPHLVVITGKEGTIYVVDRDAMSGFHADGDHIVQSLVGAVGGTWSMPAYWNGNLYYGGAGDSLRAFGLTGGSPPLTASSTSSAPETFGFPGATPVVSADGATNGIVWALQTDAYSSKGPAVLHAYDATDLSQELYSSDQAGRRDVPGRAVKFTVPVVANGKVYVGTENHLAAFGLL